MKIVHIINSLESGGAEKLLLDTLPLYNNKKIVTDLIVLNGSDYPFLRGLRSLNCCSIHSLGLHSAYNPLYLFKIIPFLKKYDVAHVHLFPSQYWVVIAKFLSGSKIKLVYTEHSSSGKRIKSSFFRKTDPFFYRQYDRVIAISENVAKVVQQHSGLNATIEIISNGVLVDTFKNSIPAQKTAFFPNSSSALKIVLQVASFKEPKDQKTVIRSLAHLPSEVQLVLVGEGILKQECVTLAKELGLEDRVLFLGIRIDVPQLLKMADIVVLSSNYEGFSLAAVEGMASGIPVIASNVDALTTIVKGAGILFKAGDELQLAAEIEKLLANELYYQDIVRNGLERAAQYDIHFMVDKHIKMYKKL
jgi:glycosyltransferase involved in cell wall biosynthesis